MHIGGILSRRGSAVRPVHLAEILAATEDGAGDGMGDGAEDGGTGSGAR